MQPLPRVPALMLVGALALSQDVDAQRFRAAHVLTAAAVTPLREAAIAAQGMDTLPFLDSTAVAELTTALTLVRRHVPSLIGAVPEGEFWAVELFVNAELAEGMKRIGRRLERGWYHSWRLTRTGTPALDSLITRFAAESLSLRLGAGPGDNRNPVLRIVFRYAMNLPAVVETLRRVPGVLAATTSPDDGRKQAIGIAPRVRTGSGDSRSMRPSGTVP